MDLHLRPQILALQLRRTAERHNNNYHIDAIIAATAFNLLTEMEKYPGYDFRAATNAIEYLFIIRHHARQAIRAHMSDESCSSAQQSEDRPNLARSRPQ
jgi:hypothetical protein